VKPNWKQASIGRACEVINGGTPDTGVAEYWDGTIPWITPAEMGRRITPYVEDTKRRLTESGLRDSSAKVLPPHSIILSSRAPIGHLVINQLAMATNQGCKGLIPHECLHYKYLYHYLCSIRDTLNALGTGATFRELSASKLKEITIPLPPISEQKRIAGILDNALKNIATIKANTETNLSNVRELFDSKLNAMLHQKGKRWVDRPLAEVSAFEGGSQPPKSEFVHREQPGYVRFLQIRDFKTDTHVTFIPKSRKNRLCTEDDILIARYGASVGQIHTGQAGAYNVALIKTVPNPKLIDRRFFRFYLLSALFQGALMGVADRSAQNGFGKDDIAQFTVPCPPLSEQRLLSNALDRLASETKRLVAVYFTRVRALDELRGSILRSAFKGEL
jgi:type I restriction enzyme S subunit